MISPLRASKILSLILRDLSSKLHEEITANNNDLIIIKKETTQTNKRRKDNVEIKYEKAHLEYFPTSDGSGVLTAKGGDIRVDMIKVRTNPKCEFKPKLSCAGQLLKVGSRCNVTVEAGGCETIDRHGSLYLESESTDKSRRPPRPNFQFHNK